jgi:nicotinate-nucleotide adenylyltransferase
MNALFKARTGILGGTFNPVHMGHLVLAQNAMEAFDLSSVVFVPCAAPPHKDHTGLLPGHHRVAMLEAALEDNLDFEVSEVETIRENISYTIDTVKELKRKYPESELFFIIGSDSLVELYSWRKIDELLELCTFVTVIRPGIDTEEILKKDLGVNKEHQKELRSNIVQGHAMDISSSDIRHRVAEGMSIKYLVPSSVEMYIAEHNLYK